MMEKLFQDYTWLRFRWWKNFQVVLLCFQIPFHKKITPFSLFVCFFNVLCFIVCLFLFMLLCPIFHFYDFYFSSHVFHCLVSLFRLFVLFTFILLMEPKSRAGCKIARLVTSRERGSDINEVSSRRAVT